MSITLTRRQWIILQQALSAYLDEMENYSGDPPFFRWTASDGPVPTESEIDALSQVVGSMPVSDELPTSGTHRGFARTETPGFSPDAFREWLPVDPFVIPGDRLANPEFGLVYPLATAAKDDFVDNPDFDDAPDV